MAPWTTWAFSAVFDDQLSVGLSTSSHQVTEVLTPAASALSKA